MPPGHEVPTPKGRWSSNAQGNAAANVGRDDPRGVVLQDFRLCSVELRVRIVPRGEA